MLVSEIMSRSPISVKSEESVENAARLMSQHKIGCLPVCTDDGSLCGMVTDRDIAVRCVAADFPASQTKVCSVMSKNPVTVSENADIHQAAQIMSKSQIRRLPVVQEGALIGMISLGDLSKSKSYEVEISKTLSEISENRRDY